MKLLVLASLARARCMAPAPRLHRVPRAATRVPVAPRAAHPPDNYLREASRLVGNLNANAALLAAFSFNALTNSGARLPPVEGAESLRSVYYLLACATLALELVSVFVGQQLMFQMYDGSFGTRTDDGSPDPERTVLGVLLSNYRADFVTVRRCFLAGVVTMMGAIGVRAWAEFEPPSRPRRRFSSPRLAPRWPARTARRCSSLSG